jgi:hypothetical protein
MRIGLFWRKRKMSKLLSNAGQRRSVKSSVRRTVSAPQLLAASRVVLEALETRVLMTTTTWQNAGGGDFDTPGNWSNGVPVAGEDAVIAIAVSAPITKTVASTDNFASLTSSQPLVLSAGTLDVTGAVQFGGSLTFQGGTLMDATLSTTGAGSLVTTSSGGTLNHVTLDSNLTISDKTNLTVAGGLTLNSAIISLAAATGATTLTFADNGAAQTLGGTGGIAFGGTASQNFINVTGNTNATSALTIGSSITIASGITFNAVDYGGGSGTISPGDSANPGIINLGVISANIPGATIAIGTTTSKGTLDNTNGQLIASGNIAGQGTLVLDTAFTNVTIGSVNSGTGTTAGTLNFSGTYTGGTLTLATTAGSTLFGSWNLVGGAGTLGAIISNSTISYSGGAILNPTSFGGTLDNTTLASNLTLPDGSTLTIQDGLVLNNANITIGGTLSPTVLLFNENLGAQAITPAASTTDKITFTSPGGTGQIKIFGNNNGTSPLTIEPGITIDGGTGTIIAGDAANPALINLGTISADVSGRTITINGTGSFDNQASATLSALNGGTLTINAAKWTNEGLIHEVSSTINLGGTFTALGTLTRTAGTVNLTGVYTVNGPFALDAITGSIRLVGGTLINAVITFDGTSMTPTDVLVPTGTTGTLNDCTLDSNMTIPNGASVTVVNGMVLNATITLASSDDTPQPGPPAAFTTLTFNNNSTSQTLATGGTGRILSKPALNATDMLPGLWNRVIVTGNATNSDVLNIDSGITIDGDTLELTVGNSAHSAIVNNGTIAADVSGTAVNIDGPGGLDNAAANAAAMPPLTEGVLQASTGATLNINCASWSDEGSIVVNAATLNMGGAFSVINLNAPDFARTGGTINLTGVFTPATGLMPLTAVTGSWRLKGGTVANANISFAGGATILTTVNGGTFSNDTLSSNLTILDSTSLTVVKGLTLNATIILAATNTDPLNPTSTALNFDDTAVSQTVGGTGAIQFGGVPFNFSVNLPQNWINIENTATSTQSLTIGSGVTIDSGAAGGSGFIATGGTLNLALINKGTIAADANGEFIEIGAPPVVMGTSTTLTPPPSTGFFDNQGSLEALNGGTLNINPTNVPPNDVNAPFNWSNEGAISETSSTIDLGGAFTALGTLNRPGGSTAGTINLTGLYTVSNASGNSIAFNSTTGFWLFDGGALINATISFSGGFSIVPTANGGDLFNCVLNSNLIIPNGANLIIQNNITLNNTTITLNSTSTAVPTVLDFDQLNGAQSIKGTGSIVLGGTSTANIIAITDVTDPSLTTLTVGPNILIHGAAGTISANIDGLTSPGNLALINNGTISADTPKATIIIDMVLTDPNTGAVTGDATIQNNGVIAAEPGTLKYRGDYDNTGGTLRVGIGGTSPGTDFGQIQITRVSTTVGGVTTAAGGAFNVAGTLTATLLGGYIPPLDTQYTVITYSSKTGTNFTTLNLTPPGAVFTNQVNATTDVLTGAPAPVAPSILTQPQNATVSQGNTATFTSTASGFPVPTVQWFVSTDGGTTFTVINDVTNPSAATTTLSITSTTPSENGSEYEAVFTNSQGTATSNAATLTVLFAPTITTQPTNQTISVGGTASFTAAASGNPTPTVQWVFSTDGGSTFNNVNNGGVYSGATTGTLTITGATGAMSGFKYEAVFLNSQGNTTTNSATLTVTLASPTIGTTQQPASAGVGSSIADQATLTGGNNPTGTVTFALFNNSTGTGTPLFTDTETLSGGTATSKGFATTVSATDYWVDTYNGDGNNNAATSGLSAEPVVVSAFVPTITTTATQTSAIVGASITDMATVSSGGSPTGTVTFNLYNNPTATGTPLFTDTETLSTGTATSKGYIAAATGTDYWVDTYNGDTNNAPVTSGVTAEPVVISAASPTIGTTQLPASAVIGSSIADQATLTGGFNPTGTVTFDLFNNSTGTGTPLFTDTETLSGGAATSKGFTTTATGTDYWVDTYNGDSNNNAITSGLAVEPVVISIASPTIVTTQQPASAILGTSIADKATLSGGDNPTGTVTFNLFNNSTGTGTPLFTDTETLSAGSATSKGFTTTALGTDYWVDTYNGDTNNNAITSGLAAEPVVITAFVPTIMTTAMPTSAIIGASIADMATVSSGGSPTGTVTFNLYNNATGTGTPLFTDTETLSSGTATSKGFTTTATGTDYWVDTYNGDANNSSVTSGVAAEPVVISPATPTIGTTQQPASAAVGTSIADMATVTGGNGPTGTVTFNLYSNPNGTGTPLFTDTETLASGSATSKGFTTTAAGTDYWVDTYNGDSNNGAATSGLAAEPVVISPVSPTISTSQQPASAAAGSSIADKATVSGGENPTGTVTFNLYNNPTGTGTPLFTDTETLSSGTASSKGFTATATGTDYWVDTYNGDSNNNAITSGLAAEPVVIGIASPTIGTTQQPASASLGASIADQATLTGGSNPTGTVTFTLYNNPTGTGTPLFTDTETLSGGTATSKGFTTTVTGTDYWLDTYNGDSNNASVTSGVAAEPVTVSNTSIPGDTIFSPTAAPAPGSQSVNDSAISAAGGVDVGIKFTSDVAGTVTGVRFYKGSLDTGTQMGELWSNTGTLLASVTFTGESASGWQQAEFSSPVLINANTVYIIAYHTTSSYIAYTPGGLTSGVDNPPLHALASGISGGDGVYHYDSTPGNVVFPNQYNGMAPNYWVDVVFSPAAAPTDSIFSPTAAPASNLQNVNDPAITSAGGVDVGIKFTSDVSGLVDSVRFYKGALDTSVHIGELWSSTGTLLASVTFTSESASGWQQANFATPVAISANTPYIVAYHTTSGTIAYTAGGLSSSIDNSPLHALASGASGGNGVYHYDFIPGTPAFPNVYNGQSPNYWVDVVFTPSTTPPPVTIFSPTSAPATPNVFDTNIAAHGGVDVGVKFTSDVSGVADGVRFYEGSQDTGVQIGELWSSTGTLLAAATFTAETGSGWQQVSFSSPVAISANTVYIIAYHTTSPYIAYTAGGLSSGIDNPPLHALANGVSGGDGVYSYDVSPGTPVFPGNYNGQAPNYWVDVVFTPN